MGVEELVADPRGRDAVRPVLFAAVLASDPADAKEMVMVKVPAADDGQHLYGPCPWSPRLVDGDTFAIPSKGDRAIVALTEEDEPWVVEWWPKDNSYEQ